MKGERKMLQKIKRSYGVAEELQEEVKKAEGLIEKYGWQNMTVAPWGHAEPIMKIIGWLKDYSKCTQGTKEMLIQLWNGLADILNAWEKHEEERTVRCLVLRGKKKGEIWMCEPWMAEMLAEDGSVEIL